MKSTRILALLLALLTVLSLIGCAADKPAAKVGDREITVQQLENSYNNSSAYASYYGYALDTAEGIEAYQDYLLDSMLMSVVAAYEARENGVTLTAEEQQQADTDAKEGYDETYQSFVDAAEQSGSADVAAYAQKLFTDTLVQNGMTVNKLKKQLQQEAEDAILVEKYRTQLLAPVQMNEEELKALYDEQLTAQKEQIAADPSQYFSIASNASYNYGYPALYVPGGLFYVKHILVEEEATAKEVEQKLKDGGDFEALLKEYGTDPGAENNPDGYLVGEGASFVQEFLDAALALEKEGDMSGVVQSSYGYHILKRYADKAAEEVPYEDVKEAFDAYAQSMADSEAYNAELEAWMADPAVVTRYPENYRHIGKDALAAITPEPAPEATAAPETTEAAGEVVTEEEHAFGLPDSGGHHAVRHGVYADRVLRGVGADRR